MSEILRELIIYYLYEVISSQYFICFDNIFQYYIYALINTYNFSQTNSV